MGIKEYFFKSSKHNFHSKEELGRKGSHLGQAVNKSGETCQTGQER